MSEITARFEQINTPDHVKSLVEEAREFMSSALGETALYLGFLQRANMSSALWEYQTQDQHSLLGINFVGNALILALHQRDFANPSASTLASLVIESGNATLFERSPTGANGNETRDTSTVAQFGSNLLAVTQLIRKDSIQPPDSIEAVATSLQAA